jgi:hypothetical protein
MGAQIRDPSSLFDIRAPLPPPHNPFSHSIIFLHFCGVVSVICSRHEANQNELIIGNPQGNVKLTLSLDYIDITERDEGYHLLLSY